MKTPEFLDIFAASSFALALVILLLPESPEEVASKSEESAEIGIRVPARNPSPTHAHEADISEFLKRAGKVAELRDMPSKREAALALARDWASSDVAGALKWANRLPGIKDRCEAIAAAISASLDPEETAHALEREGINLSQISKSLNTDFISPFTVALAREIGHENSISWISVNMTGFEQSAQISNVVGDAASVDTALAEKLLKSVLPGKTHELAMAQYLRSVAQTNPVAGLDLLAASQDKTERTKGAVQLITGWLEKDPSGLRGHLTAYPDGEFKDELLSIAAKQTAYTDPATALAISEQAGAGRKDELVSGIYKNWSLKEPLEAFRHLQAGEDSKMIEKLAPVILRAAVLNGQFAKGGDIIVGLDENEGKIPLTVQMMETWSQVKPSESAAWLTSIRPSASYDAGAEVLVKNLLKSDPDAAAMWADSIGDAERRDKARQLLIK